MFWISFETTLPESVCLLWPPFHLWARWCLQEVNSRLTHIGGKLPPLLWLSGPEGWRKRPPDLEDTACLFILSSTSGSIQNLYLVKMQMSQVRSGECVKVLRVKLLNHITGCSISQKIMIKDEQLIKVTYNWHGHSAFILLTQKLKFVIRNLKVSLLLLFYAFWDYFHERMILIIVSFVEFKSTILPQLHIFN